MDFTLFKFIVISIAVLLTNAAAVPPHEDVARMARYIVHNSDWVSISSLSTISSKRGYPFVNLKSMSDGPVSNGTGVPYLYMTDMDLTGRDVKSDNRVTIMSSLAESDYCKSRNFDPQDPRCARVIIIGKLVVVPEASDEYKFAENALYARHPSMKWWPKDHNFYIASIDLESVIVLDYFGGAKDVSIKDYFKANDENMNRIFEEIVVIDIHAEI